MEGLAKPGGSSFLPPWPSWARKVGLGGGSALRITTQPLIPSDIQSGWELADEAGNIDPHTTTPKVSSLLSPPSRCLQLFPIQNSGSGISIKSIN